MDPGFQSGTGPEHGLPHNESTPTDDQLLNTPLFEPRNTDEPNVRLESIAPAGKIIGRTPKPEQSLWGQIKSGIGDCFEWYFKPREFEREGKIYRLLGVHIFKNLLMATIGRMHLAFTKRTGEGTNYTLGGCDLEELQKFNKQTRLNETIHTIGLALGINSFVFSFLTHSMPSPTSWICFGINLMCVLLQRYNRGRLYEAMDLIAERASGAR